MGDSSSKAHVERAIPVNDDRSITIAVRIGDVGVDVSVDGAFVRHLFPPSLLQSFTTGGRKL